MKENKQFCKPLLLAVYHKGSIEEVRKERARLNRDSLAWLYGRIKSVYFLLNYIAKQLREGDSLIAAGLKITEAELPEKEFPGNAVETLLNTIKGHLDYLEQPAIRKLINQAYEENECEEIN